jgi:hypothetical protein
MHEFSWKPFILFLIDGSLIEVAIQPPPPQQLANDGG